MIFLFLANSQNSANEFSHFSAGMAGYTFKNFAHKSYDAKGKAITLTSSNVAEIAKGNYVLQNVCSGFQLSDTESGSIRSDTTKINKIKDPICEFVGNVQFITTGGLRINTEKSTVDFEKKIAQGNTSVAIRKDNSSLLADSYVFDVANKQITLVGNVRGVSQKQSIDCGKLILRFRDKFALESVSGKYPWESAEALNNAKLVSPHHELSAAKICHYPNLLTASGDVSLIYKNNGNPLDIKAEHMTATLDKAGKVKEIKATKSLTIKSSDATIHADSGVLNGSKVTVCGNVTISNPDGDVFGDVAVLDIENGDVSIHKSSGVVDNGRTK
ncbi:MAG: LPS export ABC transporter periplasmic protein LptC [Holosporaceae bacterium]|nr:LPS export ABC transporter periplasmic protein LptC [Holosporaceae bacterium]